MKKKKDVDKSRLNEIIEKRKNLKLRYLGKILCEEEKNNNKGCYVNWTENCSRSTTIPPSKIQSKYQNN